MWTASSVSALFQGNRRTVLSKEGERAVSKVPCAKTTLYILKGAWGCPTAPKIHTHRGIRGSWEGSERGCRDEW